MLKVPDALENQLLGQKAEESVVQRIWDIENLTVPGEVVTAKFQGTWFARKYLLHSVLKCFKFCRKQKFTKVRNECKSKSNSQRLLQGQSDQVTACGSQICTQPVAAIGSQICSQICLWFSNLLPDYIVPIPVAQQESSGAFFTESNPKGSLDCSSCLQVIYLFGFTTTAECWFKNRAPQNCHYKLYRIKITVCR